MEILRLRCASLASARLKNQWFPQTLRLGHITWANLSGFSFDEAMASIKTGVPDFSLLWAFKRRSLEPTNSVHLKRIFPAILSEGLG